VKHKRQLKSTLISKNQDDYHALFTELEIEYSDLDLEFVQKLGQVKNRSKKEMLLEKATNVKKNKEEYRDRLNEIFYKFRIDDNDMYKDNNNQIMIQDQEFDQNYLLGITRSANFSIVQRIEYQDILSNLFNEKNFKINSIESRKLSLILYGNLILMTKITFC
jgi:hypothetical protein